jgi:glycosyltransferase involved in cell wall biosynthesis
MKLLVIIPAYNEEKNLVKLINQIIHFNYDYLIINDHSTDNTEALLEIKGYKHLDLPVNMGISGVTEIGFKYAQDHGYDAACVIDGDGQHMPTYISELKEEYENGYDYIIGSRYLSKKKPWTPRMIGSRFISFAIKLTTGFTCTDPTSGMRMISKPIIEDFAKGMNFVAEPDMLSYILRKGYKVKEVQVEMLEREEGVSHFASPMNSLKYMFKVMMSLLFIQRVR